MLNVRQGIDPRQRLQKIVPPQRFRHDPAACERCGGCVQPDRQEDQADWAIQWPLAPYCLHHPSPPLAMLRERRDERSQQCHGLC